MGPVVLEEVGAVRGDRRPGGERYDRAVRSTDCVLADEAPARDSSGECSGWPPSLNDIDSAVHTSQWMATETRMPELLCDAWVPHFSLAERSLACVECPGNCRCTAAIKRWMDR